MENDWVRGKSSTGSVIVRVGVRRDEELGGFSFEEVFIGDFASMAFPGINCGERGSDWDSVGASGR